MVDFSRSTDYDGVQLASFVREIVRMAADTFIFSSSKSHLAYLPFSTKTNENIDGQWFDNQYIQTIKDGDKEALNQYIDRVIIPYVAPPGWDTGKNNIYLFCLTCIIKGFVIGSFLTSSLAF